MIDHCDKCHARNDLCQCGNPESRLRAKLAAAERRIAELELNERNDEKIRDVLWLRNLLLERVAEAARELIDDEDAAPVTGGYSTHEIRKCLAALDGVERKDP